MTACKKEQGKATDTAARLGLAVIDVDMGRHFDDDKKISDKTDAFAPTDTIYASVHTSGVVTNAPLVGRWTFEDGTILDEKTDSITTTGDARTIFFIVKPSGFGTGKYSLHVLIDGKEVSTRDAAVK
ncbi:MAG TPA: hypothetical protein VIJ90_04855 [Gemmatimonadaceae bacterium]